MRSHRFDHVTAILAGSGFILALYAAPSVAQTYSDNIVGYTDANLYAGSNLVANPFNAGNNTISNLFRELPSGSFFLPWNPLSRSFGPTNHFTTESGWKDGSATFRRPQGGFLWLPAPRQISFVGEPWPPMCVSFPPGEFVSGVLPLFLCGFCTSFDCPMTPPDFTTILQWDRQNQRYITCEYTIDVGWLPNPPTLTPDEAAVTFSPVLFNAHSPGFYSPAAVSLSNPSRTGTNFSFQFPSGFEITYSVQRSSNPASNVWRTILMNTGRPTDGVITVNVPTGDDDLALYRLETLRLRNPSRSSGQFQFQFFAEDDVTYEVSRSPSQANAPWQTVTTITGAGALVTAIDAAATNVTGYYRVRY